MSCMRYVRFAAFTVSLSHASLLDVLDYKLLAFHKAFLSYRRTVVYGICQAVLFVDVCTIPSPKLGVTRFSPLDCCFCLLVAVTF